MTSRLPLSLAMVLGRAASLVIATFVGAGLAEAAPDAPLASFRPAMRAPAVEERTAAYRRYVKAQADMLVGMTRVLAREITDGNLDAAQSAYAPAHRYLKRIEPAARLLRGLDDRVDARADTGFHRIEYGVFANRSTSGLSEDGQRVLADLRELRERLRTLELAPDAIAGDAAKLAREIADGRLSGDEERYSKTDLWDIEASIDGLHQILALQPAVQAQTEAHFARINALLAGHKAGCGFKNYDELAAADRNALKAAVAALADALAPPRRTATAD